MNLDTITIDPALAAERLAEYQEALRIERTAQDEALAAGFRAAARGLPIIRLASSIEAGGFFDNGLPRIAVIRATEPECYVRWEYYSHLIYSDGVSANRGALVGRHTVRVPMAEHTRPARMWPNGRTIVPSIPPRYRPRWPRLRNCHLLWEVESWTRVPPRDPALIRHIRGDLWAVLAVWDLSELERAVLAM